MKAIIIAAGSSTRLSNLTKNLPKGLLDINSKTILERQLSIFNKNHITEIILITGPLSDNFTFQNVQIVKDLNYKKHEVLGSLMAARKYFFDELIVSYSDILFDENILSQVIDFKGDIGIAVDLNWEQAYEGRTEHPREQADNVVINDGQILKIKKNISSDIDTETIGEFIGLIKFSKTGSKIWLDEYEKLEKNNRGNFQDAPSFEEAYITDMIQQLIDRKINVSPIIVSGKWCEIDTPQDLNRARILFP